MVLEVVDVVLPRYDEAHVTKAMKILSALALQNEITHMNQAVYTFKELLHFSLALS